MVFLDKRGEGAGKEGEVGGGGGEEEGIIGIVQ